jgi:D-glycero-alpha-D-manno-heptose-7-phosphate kinase
MIVSRTPHRISFFGGGTDYPTWYLNKGGKVIGTTINKYCYITCRELPPFFEHKHHIVYSHTEDISELDDIRHPSVRETFKYLNIQNGLSIHHDGDIPARSGMGSSSAFTVGLLNTLYAVDGKIVSKRELMKEAIYIEQELIKENVGSQDQAFAAYGGFNLIEFLKSGDIDVKPIIMPIERLNNFQAKFMLFFSGISRIASEVAGEQIKNTAKNTKNLSKMIEVTEEAYKVLTNGQSDFRHFGELLHETWLLKKTLSTQVSTSMIDKMYDTAMKNGAVGGKLLGAGGGGFMLLYAEPESQGQIKEALKDYLHIPFQFDFSGSKIIVYNQGGG